MLHTEFGNWCTHDFGSYYKIMENLYMRTIIDSSGKDCVLIILLQLYDTNAGLFEGNLF